ncbi:MAG: OmpP1/FadL family transporter [Acidiferrobacteraceae bacterium]
MAQQGTIRAVLAGMLLLALPAAGRASGFQFSELSATGLASADAVVADPFATGAIPYNPALMGYHPGSHLVAGAVIVDAHSEVLPATGGAVTSEAAMPRYLPQADYFLTRDNWSAGVGVDTPYALETDWPPGTFPSALTAAPLASKILVYDLHPMLGYHLGGFSLGAAVDYYYVRELLLTAPGTQINGRGEKAGYSLGVAERHGRWTFGARYRSAATASVDGAANATPAIAAVSLPWSFQAGVEHAFSRRLSLEADFQRTGWNRLRALTVTGDGGVALAQNALGWNTANAYRVALRYRLQGGVSVHLGMAAEQNPEPASYFSPRLPDAEAHLISLGASQRMGPWALDAGLAYLALSERTIGSSVPPGTYGPDMNGTSAFNGRYRTHAFLLGIGITRRFGS